MRVALFTLTLGIALAGSAAAQSSQSEFRVIYYPDAAVAAAMEGGVLEIDREVFRFRPNSSQLAWAVEFANVEALVVEPFAGPFRDVTSIVIESVEDGQKVRRRIAAVDDVSLNERAMLAGMMRLRVEQFKAARTTHSSK
jgi:hypothetical protein